MAYSESKYNLLKKNIYKDLGLDYDMPSDIDISTITFAAKLDVIFYLENINKYIDLSGDRIIEIKKNKISKKKAKNKNINESLSRNQNKNFDQNNKIKCKNKNKKNKEFQNQITVSVKVSHKKNPLSIKIFKNGSLHLTGCKSVDDFLEGIIIICEECKKIKGIIQDNKFKKIYFVDKIDKLSPERLLSINVNMINSNFNVPFKIDRPKLYSKLKSENIICEFDTNKHAGVRIKTQNKITIFVFETGSILIIVGSGGFRHIIETYYYIYKYLLESFDSIEKINL